MGFHSVLTGEDLHEPSRIRVVNDVQVTLAPGQLVKIDGPIVEGLLTITELAEEGDVLVGFVDTVIATGNESTIVQFGRLLDVVVENPATNPLANGDFLKVGSDSKLVRSTSEEGRVGVVIRRAGSAATMNVLFNPTNSVSINKPYPPAYMSFDSGGEVINTPLAVNVEFTSGATVGRTDERPLMFRNIGPFNYTEANPSFSYSGNVVTITEAGAYEFTIGDRVGFAANFLLVDNVFQDGTTDTISFNLIIRAVRTSGSIDIFRVQPPSATALTPFSSTITLNGNLEASSTDSAGLVDDRFYTGGLEPKILSLSVGDTVEYLYDMTIVKSVATNAAGNAQMSYGSATDGFFDFASTIKRVK